MNCPRCNHQTEIQQGEDSRYRVMLCLVCGWWEWLANLNKKPVEDAGYINN